MLYFNFNICSYNSKTRIKYDFIHTMTKRLRDGPVVLQSKRVCLGVPHTPVSLKRKRDDVDEYVSHFAAEVSGQRGTKRSAESFDHELQRLEKRMRASVPTAEEAIAFLLPHIMQLRGLYNAERARVVEMESKAIVMRRACLHLLREKRHLEQELELAKYRATLNGTKPHVAWHTE